MRRLWGFIKIVSFLTAVVVLLVLALKLAAILLPICFVVFVIGFAYLLFFKKPD